MTQHNEEVCIPMKHYTIQKVSGQPDWSAIPSLPIDQVHKADRSPVRAWGQVAYDDEGLLVRLRAEEANIRTEESGPLARTWEDSCLEFFFAPVEGDKRYVNVETIPSGSFFLGIGTGKHDLLRLLPQGAQSSFAPQVALVQGGWEVTFRISYTFIRCLFPSFEAKPGGTIRANCYKCGDKTPVPHWLSWSPVTVEPLNFHVPECFGTMTFG